MHLSQFSYELPEELIAKFPSPNRTGSRLMICENHRDNIDKISHSYFKNIIELLNPGDLLVLNNTKVLPARFYGHKLTGAKIEFLLERIQENNLALVYIKANKSPKPGLVVNIDNNYSITVIEKQDNLFLIKLNKDNVWIELLNKHGHLPLPPYINRNLSIEDQERYQTVYAKNDGAVAAPTAGLHFDQELLALIKAKGIEIKYVTLHVGSGTFQPVRTENILEHKMHSEVYEIKADTIESILRVQKNKNKIVAVGTTSLRCLESVADVILNHTDLNLVAYNQAANKEQSTGIKDITGETDIFIYPGYKFKIVDSLVTNFHLPGSTLMMLVSAFAGLDNIGYYYQQAIENKYRFYSYGDAMWLDRLD